MPLSRSKRPRVWVQLPYLACIIGACYARHQPAVCSGVPHVERSKVPPPLRLGNLRALPGQPYRRGRHQKQRSGLLQRPAGIFPPQRHVHGGGFLGGRPGRSVGRALPGPAARPLGSPRTFPTGRFLHPLWLVRFQLRHRFVAALLFLQHLCRHRTNRHLVLFHDRHIGSVVPRFPRSDARVGRFRQPHRPGHLCASRRHTHRIHRMALGLSLLRFHIFRAHYLPQRSVPATSAGHRIRICCLRSGPRPLSLRPPTPNRLPSLRSRLPRPPTRNRPHNRHRPAGPEPGLRHPRCLES